MILTKLGILVAHSLGHIVIDPYDPRLVNTNSVDVRVGHWFYQMLDLNPDNRFRNQYSQVLTLNPHDDPKKMYSGPFNRENGERISLLPGDKLLVLTYERVGSRRLYVPVFAGKSTSARHWIITHQAGGFGDVGYRSHWTMEIENGSNFVQHLTVGERIGQIAFYECGPPIEGGYEGSYQDDDKEPWELMIPKARPRL